MIPLVDVSLRGCRGLGVFEASHIGRVLDLRFDGILVSGAVAEQDRSRFYRRRQSATTRPAQSHNFIDLGRIVNVLFEPALGCPF